MVNITASKTTFIYALWLSITLVISSMLTGCNGGSSNNSQSSNMDPGAVKTSVELPEGSPLIGESLVIEVYDKLYPVNPGGSVTLSAAIDLATDASLMLPQRDSDKFPTVYLFSTLLPGETKATLNAEETAVSLIMNALPHSLLVNSGEAKAVKNIIKTRSQDFILNFKKRIKADPYYLHLNNLAVVYDQRYTTAVEDSLNALKSLIVTKSKTQTAVTSYRSATYEVTEGLDLQVEPEQSHYGFRIDPVKEGNYVTSTLSITNDTSLYALLTATDLSTGIDITPPLPATIPELAFDNRLLPPQQSFWGAYFSKESKIDILHRDAMVSITTGGVKDITYGEYAVGPAAAVQLRTIYSKMLMPTIGTLLSINNLALQKGVFGIMHEAGVFDTALPLFYRGEIVNGLDSVFDNLLDGLTYGNSVRWPNPVMHEILDFTLGAALTTNSAFFVKIGLKQAALKATLAIWVLDMTSVFNDLLLLPAKIKSQVNFPIDLASMEPTAITRRTGNIVEHEEITLSGFGFKTIQHTSGGHFPIVYAKGINSENEMVHELKLFPPTSLKMNDDGTTMTFNIPGGWLNAESTVNSIEVSVDHHYIARDDLNRNILHEITLPLESNKNSFIIEIGGLIINSLDKSKVQGLDSLKINTTGLSENSNYYTVYFETLSGKVEAEIEGIENNILTAQVPHFDDMEIGPISVYIQDENGKRSNAAELVFIPENVKFLPSLPNSTGEIELGITQPQGLPNIFYKIKDGSELSYSAPFILSDKTSVEAWAVKTVNNISYSSEKIEYYHSVCDSGEDFINGQCVAACNRVCDNPTFSKNVILPSVGNTHTINMSFEKTFKYCTAQIDHPEYEGDKVTMLYFYTWGSHTQSEWDEIKANNGGILPYYSPSLSPDSNFNMGTLSVIGTHTDKQIYLMPEPEIGPNTTSNLIKYFEPENLFGMIVYNYDEVSPNNKGDFLRVKIINDQSGSYEEFRTIINPEFIREDGCYEGNN